MKRKKKTQPQKKRSWGLGANPTYSVLVQDIFSCTFRPSRTHLLRPPAHPAHGIIFVLEQSCAVDLSASNQVSKIATFGVSHEQTSCLSRANCNHFVCCCVVGI
jgi:hypothetical protein